MYTRLFPLHDFSENTTMLFQTPLSPCLSVSRSSLASSLSLPQWGPLSLAWWKKKSFMEVCGWVASDCVCAIFSCVVRGLHFFLLFPRWEREEGGEQDQRGRFSESGEGEADRFDRFSTNWVLARPYLDTGQENTEPTKEYLPDTFTMGMFTECSRRETPSSTRADSIRWYGIEWNEKKSRKREDEEKFHQETASVESTVEWNITVTEGDQENETGSKNQFWCKRIQKQMQKSTAFFSSRRYHNIFPV